MAQQSDIDIIGCEEAGTVPALFFRRAGQEPDRTAFSECREGRWVDITWREMLHRIGRYRGALDRAGMVSGDRVAIMLPNCIDWVAFDIAAMANGLVTVPLYMHDSPDNIGFILAHSGARLCIVANLERWQLVSIRAEDCTALDHVWAQTGAGQPFRNGKRQIASVSSLLTGPEVDPSDVRCGPDDIATIIHTSGTTGRPKGAMLSHHALLWNAEAVTKYIPPLRSDVFLSLLPLAHAFERTMGYHLAIMGGSRVAYARSLQTLRDDILEVRPTVLIGVPRLYERINAAITKAAAASPVKKWLLRYAASVGWRRYEAEHGRGPRLGTLTRLVVWPVLERIVARRVLGVFGGRMRVAASGGAPLPADVAQFLIGLGLPLIEGYGLTEAAPVVTAATFEDYMPGSVGRPLQGVQTRIAQNGELLLRSPALMKGYWNDPAQTSQALTEDGWLRTGDMAEFREGRLFITGRLKDLTVLSTGKKVAPAVVEEAIESDPLFDQACVVGNSRASLVALCVLNDKAWASLAREKALDPSDPNQPAARAAIRSRLAQTTRALPSYSRVRRAHALLEPWTVENGALTPTLKIRRSVIEGRYRAQIDALYKELENMSQPV